MPILDKWEINLTIDDVLHAQGAELSLLKLNRPQLINNIVEAITKGTPLLHPRVLYETFNVQKIIHERLLLKPNSRMTGNIYLSGPLIAQHLAHTQKVIIILCTIGKDLDEFLSSYFKFDPLIGMALNGVGSAAVESLAIQACNFFEAQAKSEGLNTTMPLNPGMVGWSLDEGQLQIFTLLDSEQINVSLNEYLMMIPNKSLSMVLGLGTSVAPIGSSCDYCTLKGVCNYQNHYAK